MPYIATNSAAGGAAIDNRINAGTKQAMKEAASGDLAGVFKAQGTSAETTIAAGAMAASTSAGNDAAKGAANK